MTPTNKQILILIILVIAIFGFGFVINHTTSAVKELSLTALNVAGVETGASFDMSPARVTGLDYDVKNGTVFISWRPIMKSRLNGYRIYRGDSPDARFIIGGSNQANFVDRDVQYGAVYYYGVTAVNDLGESHISTPLRVRIR